MSFNPELCRAQIRQAMRESVGKWQPHSLKEAAQITGLHASTLYQIANGQMAFPEKHLPALLDIPAFGERYMSLKGHACAFIGNEEGCEWQAIGSVLEAAGEAGPMVADRKIDNTERKRLYDRMHVVVRKAQAFLHRFSRDRVAAQVRV